MATDIDRDVLQLLMELGYLACGAGMLDRAETIFQGIRAVRPESELPFIGLACVQLSRGQAEAAIALLEGGALKQRPESDVARAFEAFALLRAGRSAESERLCHDIVESNRDPQATALAQAMLRPERSLA